MTCTQISLHLWDAVNPSLRCSSAPSCIPIKYRLDVRGDVNRGTVLPVQAQPRLLILAQMFASAGYSSVSRQR